MAGKKPQPKHSDHRNSSSGTRNSKTSGASLRGQVAVVTGASRGIGFEIALLFAREGASVVITGRNAKTLAQSARKLDSQAAKTQSSAKRGSGQVMAEVCDVRDPESVSSLFEAVRRHFGRVDILVNNAGITQPMLSVEETTLEIWRDVIDTNLTGIFLCTRSALPLIRQGGTIVNIISAAAKQAFPKYAAYTAAKQGALGFTLVLREELIPRGIRVVALIPGATDTALWEQLWPDAPRKRMMSAASVAQAVLCAVSLPAGANVSELVISPIGGAL